MELTMILLFVAVVILPFLVNRHKGRCGMGGQVAIKSAVLLAFVTVATVGRSQYDTCITFAEETFNQFPAGWTVTHGGGYDARYSRDAYVSTISHNTPMGLYLTGNQDFYISMPYMATDFGDGANLLFWTHGECTLEVGSAADPADISSFHPLASFSTLAGWQRHVADLSSVPPGDHYIVFHKVTNGFCTLDDIRVITNGCLMWDFHAVSDASYAIEKRDGEWLAIYKGCDSVLPPVAFTWNATDGTMAYVDVSTAEGNTLLNSLYSGIDTARVQLSENGSYIVSFGDNCGSTGYCSTSIGNETQALRVVRPACDSSACIDTRMLFSTKVTPFYGIFTDPYQYVGVVDDSINGRHVLCTDTSATDPVVGMPLRMVPPGDDHSVRLGNMWTMAQAEGMLYRVFVDTTDFDMLILKYAGVMQNPMHQPWEQPRFRIEMLDPDGRIIEPAKCNSYDFVASYDMGWNTTMYRGQPVMWKDWTVVGLDLSAYHGQEVQLRLTTYDCSEGAHFGYAYYNLHCAKKNLSFSTCTEGEFNRVEAPEGFLYRWHRQDSDSVLSTSRVADLPADGNTYLCDLSFIGDTSCVVTLSAESRLVWPEADFSYSVSREDCRFRVDFSDRSHHEGDSATACDWIMWDFGPFGTSTLRNPVVFFPDSGAFTVSLVAGIGGGPCTDTLAKVLRLQYASDTLDTAVCANQPLPWMDSLYGSPGSYVVRVGCDTLRVLNLSLIDTSLIDTLAVACGALDYRGSSFHRDTVADFLYANSRGCDSLYRLHLTVHPEYELADTLVVCPGSPFVYGGVDYGGPATFDTLLVSTHGCDSLVHMALVPRPPAPPLQAAYSFDGIHWSDTLPMKVCAPATLFLRDSTPDLITHRWTLLADTLVSAEGTLEYDMGKPSSLPADQTALATLVAVDSYGCADTLRWPIFIFPSPQAEFSWYPFHPCDACPEAEFDNLTLPADCQWQWTFATTEGAVDTLFDFAPVYQWQGTLPSGDFDVSLAATNHHIMTLDSSSHIPPFSIFGPTITHTCTDTVTHTVSILPSLLQFPNLVTPNGDGVNDRWRIVNLLEYGLYSMNELWIYSRWGDLVYHVRDIHDESQFWDPADPFCPDGTYFFRFSAKSFCGLIRLNGVIEVVR